MCSLNYTFIGFFSYPKIDIKIRKNREKIEMEMTQRERYIREMVMANHSGIIRRAIERLMNEVCEEVITVHSDIEEADVGAFITCDEDVFDKETQTQYDMGIIERLLLEKLTE